MKKNLIYIVLIFIITIILLYALFTNSRLYGHDTIFHTGNIYYLSKTININNIFGNNIISIPINKFGYGTWIFYPKLPHLLGSYIYIITNNLYLSMNIVYFITTFISGICTYYLSKKLFNNNKVAFLSSIIYLTYSYHLCEIYIRDAYAENFMFLVIPLIFLGLFELKDNSINKFYLLFITGYVIGIHSHLISMVFCTIFVFLFLIYYRKIFLTINKIKKLLLSTLIVTCISLPFLTTIIEHKIYGNYVVFTDSFSSRDNTISNVIQIKDFINNNESFVGNNIIVYINYFVFILIVITTVLFFFKSNRKKYKDYRKLLFFGSLICISFISSNYLWNKIPEFFSTIQFPWRIMIFFSLIISLYAPLLLLLDYKINKKIINIIYIITIIIIIKEGLNNISYYGDKEYSTNEILSSSLIMGWNAEYLPVNSLNNNFIYSIEGLIKNTNNKIDNISILEDNFPSMKFKVTNNNSTITIPRTYYLGYTLKDNNNNKYKLKESPNGLIKANIKNNKTYTLKYTGTILDRISKIISIITIIITIIGGSRLWKIKK